jgi:phospholipid/cholesterol/gamma-HCH transport system substrate-binding protein
MRSAARGAVRTMSNEAKVGLFVITALVIFVASFIAIANVQLRGGLVPYKTYFSFAGGVERGSVVRFGGRKAGVVTGVRPWAEDPTRVEVLLEVNPETPIRADAVASVSSLGLLGENYIEITPGKKDAAPVPPHGTISSVEAVNFAALTRQIMGVTERSEALIADLHQNLNSISGKADELLVNLNALTGEKNRQSVEQLLNRSNQLVADQAPKIDRITSTLEQTTLRIDLLIGELRATNTRAGDLIANVNRTVDETRDPLQASLRELETTLTEARTLLDQLQGTLAANDENLSRTIENFRATSQNLSEFSAEIKQRPFSLIRIKPKPDRKVPAPAAGR